MAEMNGIDACRAIVHALPASRVVVVTAVADAALARAAINAGASAFVRKELFADDLELAIENALAGRTYCSAFAT